MDIILSKDVKGLGAEGDVVKVKQGYARNFLIPQKLAYAASEGNIRRIDQLKKKRQLAYDLKKKEARGIAEKLSKASCTVAVEVNDLDKLYGAVNDVEIVKALEVEGFTIDKKDLIIENPILELGIFEVGVKLHPEVTTKIRLWVTKK